MHFSNRLSARVGRLAGLPPKLRSRLQTWLIGRAVRFAGTGGVVVRQLTPLYGEFTLANRPRVRNHLGGIHAAAVALLAETASGLVFGMNVPDTHIALLRRLNLDYVRRSRGDLEAVASLPGEQADAIRAGGRGEIRVQVEITDQAGEQPVICELVWAWVPRDPAALAKRT